MKKSSLLMTVVMCLMSVSLFAAPAVGGDDVEVVKVLTAEEVSSYNLMNADFSEMTSVQVLKMDGKLYLEISGVDTAGNAVTILKDGGYETLPCGSCEVPSGGAPWSQGYTGSLVFFETHTACLRCDDEYVPGPE